MMEQIGVWLERLRAVFAKERMDRDFNDELAAHVDLLTTEGQRQGLTPEEARRRALIRIGGEEPVRELHRDTRGLPSLESFVQDLRYTIRGLVREPGFFVVAALILALGIGAATAVFTVVNALLIRPLPFRNPDRLVWIANTDGNAGLSSVTFRVNQYLGWYKQTHTFDEFGAYFAFSGYGTYKLVGQGEPERLLGVGVSQNFLHTLGVQPDVGRAFNQQECQWNGGKMLAVVLTHRLWVRRFGADPGIVGRKITLNMDVPTVVGVLPDSFDFAATFTPGARVDFLYPFPLTPETDRWGNTIAVVGRLKPSVPLRTARAEFQVIVKRLQKTYPDWGTTWDTNMTGLQSYLAGNVRRPMLVLSCAVGLVMLIVCANLSNLLLARGAVRRKEIAVRTALGAGRPRIIRQMLTESVALSLFGGAVGLIFAFAAVRALEHVQGMAIALLPSISIDPAALLFCLAVALLTGVVFGIAPAFQTSSEGLHEALKDSARGMSEGVKRNWVRDALVVSEIALACMLLVGAGLVIRSFVHVLDVDLGFRPDRTASLRVEVNGNVTAPQKVAFLEEVLRRVRDVPGVQAAGMTDSLPMDRNRSWGVPPKGRTYRDEDMPVAFVRIVSPGYIGAMGIRLIEGRDFTPLDTDKSEKVVLVNETMARALWPGQDPIGRIVETNGDSRIVGLVADVRQDAPDRKPGLEVYLPYSQDGSGSFDLVLRTKQSPEALAPAIRAALRPIDPNLPMTDFRSLETLVDRAVSPRRFVTILLGGFALLALLLASLGIYGIISYSVTQRNREIGIRMALGATAANVQLRVIRQTLALAFAGIFIGVMGAWALTRLLGSLLFGVTATDPATFAAMVATLMAVAILAGYLPARRASKIDPIITLRSS